ncbi:MAG: beta-phosphoglucomutase family hydrolase [Gemmatimonadales bacterium]|jgi:alpha,alpha-trehalase
MIDLGRFDAVLFDLDGVLTATASVHSACWKRMFDEFLETRAAESGEAFRPFDIELDYLQYVDGKPRYDGVESFLCSRGIRLPWGDPTDPPGQDTVCALGNRKNELFNEVLAVQQPDVFGGSVALAAALKDEGVKIAVVSASKNAVPVLEAAEIADLFDLVVDGKVAARLGLAGKPAPDPFVEAARELAVSPSRAVVIEDAISGVQAGRAGDFGLVIGVDREGIADELRRNGADIVVSDLSEISLLGRKGSAQS